MRATPRHSVVGEARFLLTRFVTDDQGQDLIEYLLLGSFIAIMAVVAVTNLGTQLNAWFDAMGTWVNSATEATKSVFSP